MVISGDVAVAAADGLGIPAIPLLQLLRQACGKDSGSKAYRNTFLAIRQNSLLVVERNVSGYLTPVLTTLEDVHAALSC
jgi:hypothetical protein